VDLLFGLEEQTLYEAFPHCQRKRSTWCHRLNCPALPCPICFGCGDGLFHRENCCFISRSLPQIQVLSPVMVLQRKLLSLLSWSCKSLHTGRWFCLWSSFSRWSTKFAAFGSMFIYSFTVHWHLLYCRPECYRHQPDRTVDR
jgi:hypothetical protein